VSEILTSHNMNLADLDVAKTAAEILNDVYPGWLWATNCELGLLRIFNLNMEEAIRRTTKSNLPWGMTLKVTVDASASELKKRVIMAGGELLERSHQVVGRFADTTIKNVDMVA
jgi:hypothetical protein